MKTYDERSRDVADKLNQQKKQRKLRRRIIAGTCLCLAVVLLGTLFIPYDKTMPSVEEHAENPYYQVIQKINQLTYSPPRYDNPFQALMAQISSGLNKATDSATGADGAMMNGSAAMPGAEIAPEYVEVTDNQVAGVTEADIFKRSSQYLYYLNGTELRIYSIAGEASAEIGSYSIDGFNSQNEKEDSADYAYINTSEMYLSADCTTVTVVGDIYTKASGSATMLLNLDVSDPANITQLDYILFPGNIISSRMVEGKLLLTYNYRISTGNLDYDQPETFVPSYGKPGDMTCIDAGDILCPDTATDTRYTVVCQLDGKTLAVEDAMALLSYAQELYVSENAIYATHSYTQKSQVDANVYSNQTMTKISGIAYGDGQLRYRGSIELAGSVKDQYAMDEYDGVLRVVTNTFYTVHEETRNEDISSVSSSVGQRNVSLYCIDLSSWKVAASVLGFAPEGERAESVRFDETAAYVCTAEVITLTDPVYFFDLSDLENITYTDTGTIDGYSSSLIQLGDGFLMGIGYGDEWQMKIEVYEEYNGEVVSVDAWEESAGFSEEYKAYFIDREHDLVGLAITPWGAGGCQYVLLHFDGYKLQELLRVDMQYTNTSIVRACLIDGYLYILNYDCLMVEKVW